MIQMGRKGAFFLLAVAALWSALPAAACLLNAHTTNRPACCSGMTPDCPMHSPEMNSLCCQIQPGPVIAIPDPLVLHEHGQTPFVPLYWAGAVAPLMLAAPGGCSSEASPPDVSIGARTILRI
jgi:hypothetical protein